MHGCLNEIVRYNSPQILQYTIISILSLPYPTSIHPSSVYLSLDYLSIHAYASLRLVIKQGHPVPTIYLNSQFEEIKGNTEITWRYSRAHLRWPIQYGEFNRRDLRKKDQGLTKKNSSGWKSKMINPGWLINNG